MLDKRHDEWARANSPNEVRGTSGGGGGGSAGPYDRGIGLLGIAYVLFGLCFLSMLFNSGKYLYVVCYRHEMAWSTVIFMRFVVITGVLYGLTHLFEKLATKHPGI